ncbi:MAG TPA: hypothetical protein VFE32_21375 [Puia sp.]|jgi:hypothetical protein|nr:hypothetical protein [Puia sp.]
MKKSSLAAVCGLALLLSSCAKHGLISPGNTIDYCRITTMSGTNPGDLIDTLTFYYNADGTPSHLDRLYVSDGSPKYLFRYDRQGRLLDYIAAFDNGAAEAWTRYYYNEASRMVIDTQYTEVFQYQTWPPAFFAYAFSEVKHYDNLGRIISYKHYVLYQVPGTDSAELMYSQAFTYNREGNLVGLGYDNKINIHRTNPVWQFIDNDYATNNLLPLQQYNAYGLPSEMTFSPGAPFLFDLEAQTMTIRYSCDMPVRKGEY